MDGTRDCHTEWSKSDGESEISYDIIYVQNLKKMIQRDIIFEVQFKCFLWYDNFLVSFTYVIIWLHWVLVAALKICSCGMVVDSVAARGI